MSSMGNVRLFIRKGENEFHWFIRSLYLYQAREEGMGMTQYLKLYKAKGVATPKYMLVDSFYADTYASYTEEVNRILVEAGVSKSSPMPDKDKVIVCIRDCLSKMCKQYKVDWSKTV